MSLAPKDSTAVSKCDASGDYSGDYLWYFIGMVLEVFSKDGNLLVPFPELDSVSGGNGSEHDNSSGPSLLFEKGMVHNISDYRRERLNSLLNESKDFIKHDIDEMVDNIIAINKIETDFMKHRNVEQSTRQKGTQVVLGSADLKSPASFKKVYSNFQRFLGEGLEHMEAIDKLRNEVSIELGKLKLRLEDYLDVLTSKSRPMTPAEKQQLGQEIQKLPKCALDRVVEITQRRMIPQTHPSDRVIDVNLEEADNTTLWRLYTFVQAVATRGSGQ